MKSSKKIGILKLYFLADVINSVDILGSLCFKFAYIKCRWMMDGRNEEKSAAWAV